MNETEQLRDAPSLQRQTIELGTTLKVIADGDPSGTPSEMAASVFAEWVQTAGPGSREPRYFADVAENFDVFLNSNQDLFDMFHILETYIEIDDEPEDYPPGDEAPRRTFIGLPIIG